MGRVDQDIRGNGVTPDAAVLRRAIVDRGKHLAAEFAPGGVYREPSVNVEHVILDECLGRYEAHPVDPAGVTVQINEETAGMQSEFWVERANPGGIGAIDAAPGQAIDFTVDDRGQKRTRDQAERQGIRAHVAKLRNYRYGEGPWSHEDPRFAAVKEAGYLGIARTWRDLQGHWASSPTYAQSLTEIWAALDRIALQEHPMSVDISSFVPPRIVQQWFPVNGVSYLGEDMEMWGCCVHETGNTSPGAEAQANVTYMSTAECVSRQASWHSTVGLDIIIETIPQTKQAFHASDDGGPGNTHFKAIEGVMCYPVGTPQFRRVMLNHAWYVAKSLREAGLPCNVLAQGTVFTRGATVAQHNTFARDHKDCPAFYRDSGLWDQFTQLVGAFYNRNEWGAAMAAGDPNSEQFPTGHYIVNDHGIPFLTWFRENGGWERWGYPLEGMHLDADGVYRQLLENVLLEGYPNGFGPHVGPYVRIGGLGQRFAVLQHKVEELEAA